VHYAMECNILLTDFAAPLRCGNQTAVAVAEVGHNPRRRTRPRSVIGSSANSRAQKNVWVLPAQSKSIILDVFPIALDRHKPRRYTS
jgi:hypothetical protein